MKNLFFNAGIFTVLMATGVARADLMDNYNFDTAAAGYAGTEQIVHQDARLLGKWKMVATCSRSYKGDFSKKDSSGLKNQDRSIPQLSFSMPGKILVDLLNLGVNGQNQGPAEVLFSEQAGYATFAQYSYRAGQPSDVVYFMPECRLLGSDLLCAKRFFVNKPDEVNADQRSIHLQIVGYDLFRR